MNQNEPLDGVGTPLPERIGSAAVGANRRRNESFKETIESIVVALILAFVFRAFVVEAFVIPTGSMAPTLYGAHGTVLCENCGTEFAYGLHDLDDKRRGGDIGETADAICSNCNYPNTNLVVNDRAKNPEKGDRILVLKWPYDLGLQSLDPSRWDVIVFKDPSDGTTNFIKRCAGVPNEVLMILDGDVYGVPIDKLSAEVQKDFEDYTQAKYELLQGARKGKLEPPPARVFAELDQKLQIRRKAPAAQDALWHLVYDHDHPPQKLENNQPRWEKARRGESGWDTSDHRARYVDRGAPLDYIELTHKDIRATCAYNIYQGYAPYAPFVSDQRVRFVLTPKGGDAIVRVRLVKRNRSFWAELRMDGRVSLYESSDVPGDTTPVMVAAQLSGFVPGRGVEVRFEDVDYRLTLFVGGKEVLTSSSEPGSTAYFGPDIRALRLNRKDLPAPPPRIFGSGGNFDLAHLVVDRDEHYFNDTRIAALPMLDWAPREGWGGSDSPIMLRPGEYFMLGDNTAASKDSRLWEVVGPHLRERGSAFQLGTVPRDQLIGRAFFVYWPSGHRLDWAPLLGRFGIIPDVGRMRWIR